jgi:hypothetical protein
VTIDLEGALAASEKAWSRARLELQEAGVKLCETPGHAHVAA